MEGGRKATAPPCTRRSPTISPRVPTPSSSQPVVVGVELVECLAGGRVKRKEAVCLGREPVQRRCIRRVWGGKACQMHMLSLACRAAARLMLTCVARKRLVRMTLGLATLAAPTHAAPTHAPTHTRTHEPTHPPTHAPTHARKHARVRGACSILSSTPSHRT